MYVRSLGVAVNNVTQHLKLLAKSEAVRHGLLEFCNNTKHRDRDREEGRERERECRIFITYE